VSGAGAAGSGGISGPTNVPSDTVVRVYTELMPFSQRRGTQPILEDLEAAVANIPGVFTEVTAVDQGPPIGKDIGIQISSENPEDLRAATQAVKEKLASMDGIIEIEDTTPLPGVEWEFIVDRAEAGRLGLDIGRIGAALSLATEGTLVGQYRPLDADEEIDIRIRYPSESRTLAELDRLRIQTPQGSLPLSSVARRVAKPRQDKIERKDLLPYYIVQANTAKDYATQVQVAELTDWLEAEADFSSSVQTKFLGQQEENADALKFLAFYSYVSMILSLTGVIALAGIVVNNNIVLIDAYQRLLERGYGSIDAAIRTAAQRLRPVFLTTLTTVVGLMPLILGWQANIFTGEFSTKGSSTSEIWAPISYVVACGLGFATILTLIVTPVMLAMPTVISGQAKRLYRWSKNKIRSRKKETLEPSPAE